MAFAWVTLAAAPVLSAAWILAGETGVASKSGGDLHRLMFFLSCITVLFWLHDALSSLWAIY